MKDIRKIQAKSIAITAVLIISMWLGLYLFEVTTVSAAPYSTPGTSKIWYMDDLVTNSSGTVTFAGGFYYIHGDVTISGSDTLTISPGTVIKFDKGAPAYRLSIQGDLIAKGSESNLITFTSNESTPAPGDWDYIYFTGDCTNSRFENCSLAFATDGLYASSATNLKVKNVTLTASTIGITCTSSLNIYITYTSINGSTTGITCSDSSPVIENCSLNDCSNLDFFLSTNSKIIAINTSFNGTNVNIASGCTLTVKNYLHLRTNYTEYAIPIPNAEVEINDNRGVVYYQTSGYGGTSPKTDANGELKWILVTDCVYNGSGTATEYDTHINISLSGLLFTGKLYPQVVDMSTSHPEVFTAPDYNDPVSQVAAMPQYTNTTVFEVAYTASDILPGTGLKHVELWCKRDNLDFAQYPGVYTSSPISFNSSNTGGDGKYLFKSIAEDNANNREVKLFKDTETVVDTTAPGYTDFEHTNITEDSAGACTIRVNITETLSGLNATPLIRYRYNSADAPNWDRDYTDMELEDWSADGGTYIFKLPEPAGGWNALRGNIIEWQLRCKDNASNFGITELGISETTDLIDDLNDPPTCTLTGPITSEWVAGTVYLTATASDSNEDLGDTGYGIEYVNFRFSLDSTDGTDGVWDDCDAQPDYAAPYNITWYSEPITGTDPSVWVRAVARDNGGSFSSYSYRELKVDNMAPSTGCDYDHLWHNTSFYINLQANDTNGSGVKTVYYKLNDGGPVKTVAADGQPKITTEGGSNALFYWAVDALGNEEEHHILTAIKLDSTNPSITGWQLSPLNLTSGSEGAFRITVNITDTHNGSGISETSPPMLDYRLEAGSYVGYDQMTFLLAADGGTSSYEQGYTSSSWHYTIPAPSTNRWENYAGSSLFYRVRCTDLAGNSWVSTEQRERIEPVVIGNQPPTITHTPLDEVLVDEVIKITAQVTDDVRVVSVTLYYKNIGDTEFNWVNMKTDLGLIDYSTNIPTQTLPGNLYYYISATDAELNGTHPATNAELYPHVIHVIEPEEDSDGDGMPDYWEEWYLEDGLDPNAVDKYGDLDSDGLLNIEEYWNNTHPNNKDTDGDGLPDGWEVEYGLSPTDDGSTDPANGPLGDPDGDDYTNREEYEGGSNPNDPGSTPKAGQGDETLTIIMIIIVLIIIIIMIAAILYFKGRPAEIGDELWDEDDELVKLVKERESEDGEEDEEELQATRAPKGKGAAVAVTVTTLETARVCSGCGKAIHPRKLMLKCSGCSQVFHNECLVDLEECPNCGAEVSRARKLKAFKPRIVPGTERAPELDVGAGHTSAKLLCKPHKGDSDKSKKTREAIRNAITMVEVKNLGNLKTREVSTSLAEKFGCYLELKAFKSMVEHCLEFADDRLEVMGFLIGDLYYRKGKKKTEANLYSDINRIIPGGDLNTSHVSVKFTDKSFANIFEQLQELDEAEIEYKILGWYHSHPGLGCFISGTDLETINRNFKRSYNVSIVIDPIEKDIKLFKLKNGKAVEIGCLVYG